MQLEITGELGRARAVLGTGRAVEEAQLAVGPVDRVSPELERVLPRAARPAEPRIGPPNPRVEVGASERRPPEAVPAIRRALGVAVDLDPGRRRVAHQPLGLGEGDRHDPGGQLRDLDEVRAAGQSGQVAQPDDDRRLAAEGQLDLLARRREDLQTPSFSRTRRVTSAPSARPCVSRMTWPMIAPMAFMLPALIFSATSALALSAASTIGASSSPPPIAARPSASTIASGSPPSVTSLSSTCLPASRVIARCATSATRRAKASGDGRPPGRSSSSTRWSSSLRTQLARSGASTPPSAPRAAS